MSKYDSYGGASYDPMFDMEEWSLPGNPELEYLENPAAIVLRYPMPMGEDYCSEPIAYDGTDANGFRAALEYIRRMGWDDCPPNCP